MVVYVTDEPAYQGCEVHVMIVSGVWLVVCWLLCDLGPDACELVVLGSRESEVRSWCEIISGRSCTSNVCIFAAVSIVRRLVLGAGLLQALMCRIMCSHAAWKPGCVLWGCHAQDMHYCDV